VIGGLAGFSIQNGCKKAYSRPGVGFPFYQTSGREVLKKSVSWRSCLMSRPDTIPTFKGENWQKSSITISGLRIHSR
ncbi:MAG: hypothetical protein ACE5JU_22800, partial [Candidatus Binatia bacterium]